MTSPMSARLKLIRRATDLRQKANRNFLLTRRRYQKYYHGRVRITPTLHNGNYVFLGRLLHFRSAAKRSDSEGYNKLLLCKQGPYKASGVTQNTLQIEQDLLKNTVSIQREVLSSTSKHHCNDHPAQKEEDSSEEETRSWKDCYKNRDGTENTYVVDRT